MDVNRIGSVGAAATAQKAAVVPLQNPPVSQKSIASNDAIELSAASTVSQSIDVSSEFRAQRLAQIQQQIADGTYETPEKLDAAIDRLLEKLASE